MAESATRVALHQHIDNATSQLTVAAELPGTAVQIALLLRESGLGFTSLCVYLIDRNRKQGRNYYLDPGPAGWVNQSFTQDMAPLAVHLEQHARRWKDPDSQDPIWFLTVPTSRGAVEIAGKRTEAFTAKEERLLADLAPSLQLLAMRHRDLEFVGEAGSTNVEAREEMEFLHHSSAELSGGDQDQVTRKLVLAIIARGTFDRAGVFLVDDEQGVLRGTWGVDQQGELAEISDTILPLQGTAPEQKLSEAARIVSGELDHFLAHDLDGDGARSREGNIAANLSVPMCLGRRIMGVLAVDNYLSRRPIHQDQVLPLQVLANQAALAIENSRLRQGMSAEGSTLLASRESAPHRGPFPGSQDQPSPFDQIIALSPAMRKVMELARMATATDHTVLILGESGTGKDLLAHAIHAHSQRRTGPLVVVNSASLSSGLEDSELFGHVKGAFTHAIRENTGLVAAAHGGTLFLDEIGDLSSSSQAKLLRTLESGEVRRVGDTQVIKVDIRCIAATNRDLRRASQEGTFRADLYYRLAVITIQIPPLRERPEDILPLAHRLLGRIAVEMGRRPEIAPAVLDLLVRFSWPGNARQLHSCLRHAELLAEGGTIREEHLPEELLQSLATTPANLQISLPDLERRHILQVLEQCGRDRQKAQHLLGISRATLQRRLKEYGINP